MLLSAFDILYFKIPQGNVAWRTLRFLVRVLSNIYVMFFMRVRSRNVNSVDESTVIVSLTTFPARIHNVWMTIACLLNQEAENIHVVLWLSKEQFCDERELPSSLLKMQKKGLEIRFVEDDIRPHKKYYYALQLFPNNCIVTVDDDVLYNPKMLSYLIRSREKHPDCVICNRSAIISRMPYKRWLPNKKIYEQECFCLMPTGVGGVLYPPHIFDGTDVLNVRAIKQTCLNGDDLWLNFWTRFAGHRVVQTRMRSCFISVKSSQKNALCVSNLDDDKNDVQISLINEWVKKKFGESFLMEVEECI